jgi:hypothetical protein
MMRTQNLIGRSAPLFGISNFETDGTVFARKNTLVRRFRVPNGRVLP